MLTFTAPPFSRTQESIVPDTPIHSVAPGAVALKRRVCKAAASCTLDTNKHGVTYDQPIV